MKKSKKTQGLPFNPREIKLAIDLPPPIKILKPFMGFIFKLLDHIQKPLFVLFRRFGKPFGEWLRFLPETTGVRLEEYLLETSDGAKMATDVYIPKKIFESKGKGPTIFVRMPYWKDMLSILGYFFSAMGYITVLQDIRGCAHSIDYGTNSFFTNEGIDGREALEWISKRFWYNGKIGMWGVSYLGITQLSLTSDHKGLVTCFNPIECSYTNIFWNPGSLYRIGMSGSVYIITKFITQYRDMPPLDMAKWDPYGMAWTLFFNPYFSLYNEPLELESGRKAMLSDLANMTKIKYQLMVMNKMFDTNVVINKKDDGSYDKLLKGVFYDRLMKHDHKLLPFSFGTTFEFDAPMLMVGGWYDMFIEETLIDLKEIQKNSPELFKTNFKIMIGPWSHGNLDKMGLHSLFGKIYIKKNIALMHYMMQFWWFEHWLRGPGTDLTQIPPVTVYVMNKKIWRNFHEWPPLTDETPYYLHSNGKANSRYGDGSLLTKEPIQEKSDQFIFNPLNPVIMKGGRNLLLLSGAQNQSKIEEREDILVYSTEKLREGVEVIGEIKVVLYASSSAKDTDFIVKLIDVYPKGKKALNVVDGGMRARYRNGDITKGELLEPGKIYKYEIYIGSTGIYFKKNHKIRIEITSSNFPRWDVNSNLGGEKGKNGAKYTIANQTIYHDTEHPSHLILPVYRPDK